ncbi:DUF3429 domain-containing protein [Parasphingorhabdus halotolerans]|uniref:DUF3429 domain-containing protein n=1 Tax=Parasphingorhabdus halotolerans TaxID=2725558 RepID=A0A6H2DNZ1_9SPHN|nr:DUF3429 domain-containing protein [Parasphingorhabdus halotolerans]
MQNNRPPSASILGLAGLLPQLLCLVAVFDDDTRYIALSAAFLYAAVIFSFLGGLWWGLAVTNPKAPQWVYGIAVVPSLLAVVSGIPWMIGTTWPGPSLALLGIALIAALWIDFRLNRLGMMPVWMLRLRIILSTGLGLTTLALAAL